MPDTRPLTVRALAVVFMSLLSLFHTPVCMEHRLNPVRTILVSLVFESCEYRRRERDGLFLFSCRPTDQLRPPLYLSGPNRPLGSRLDPVESSTLLRHGRSDGLFLVSEFHLVRGSTGGVDRSVPVSPTRLLRRRPVRPNRRPGPSSSLVRTHISPCKGRASEDLGSTRGLW